LRVHPLVTVKKAASLLGVDKRTIREKLRAGELRGELRRVGMKDKWFVYSGEVDFLIENQRIPELEARAERTSLEGMNPLFEEKSEDTESDNINSANCAGNSNVQDSGKVTLAEDSMITEAIPAVVERKPGQLQMPFEQVIEIMTRHFSLRFCEEQDKLEELRRAVVNQSVVISEIPALRAKLSEQEDNNRDLRQELHDLKNQIEVMQRPFTTRVGDWFKKNLK
jgi:excisionase family DNA binding protein